MEDSDAADWVENGVKVLAIIVTRDERDCQETLSSLENQTLKPEVTITIGKPDKNLVTGEIVGRAMNEALSKTQISGYDFLLKSDDDIWFPPWFLEVNTQSDYDAMGRGAGLLIRVKPFLDHVKRWDTTSLEDSYPFYALMLNDHKVLTSDWVLSARLLKPSTEPSDFRRMWACGRDCYRVGFPFKIYVKRQLQRERQAADLREKLAQVWAIAGYMYASAAGLEKLPIAREWSRYQWIRHARRLN